MRRTHRLRQPKLRQHTARHRLKHRHQLHPQPRQQRRPRTALEHQHRIPAQRPARLHHRPDHRHKQQHRPHYHYDPDGNANSTGNGATTELRYAGGHVIDGLYHFGARYYDPTNARWTQQDPLNAPGDLKNANRYLYVGGDPINSIDPAGLFVGDVVDFIQSPFPSGWAGDLANTVWGCANPFSQETFIGMGVGASVGFVAGGAFGLATGTGVVGAVGFGLMYGSLGFMAGAVIGDLYGCTTGAMEYSKKYLS